MHPHGISRWLNRNFYGSRTTRKPIIRCDWNDGHAADLA